MWLVRVHVQKRRYSLSIMGFLGTGGRCGGRVDGTGVIGTAVEGTPFSFGLGE